MKLKAVVIILRKDQVFRTAEAIIHRSWGFRGFTVDKVAAYYRKDDPVDGYGVALIIEPSPADQDFKVPILFLSEWEIKVIGEAFDKSDELTHRLLGHGWTGVRPYLKVEDFI